MKRLFISLFSVITISAMAQPCSNNFTYGAISYQFPKGAAIEVGRTFSVGLNAAAGVAYQAPNVYRLQKGNNTIDSIGNMADIYAIIGWRVFAEDYKISIYANAGYVFGDVAGAQPLASVRFLFPVNNIAISLEPGYIFGRGETGRISVHFKL